MVKGNWGQVKDPTLRASYGFIPHRGNLLAKGEAVRWTRVGQGRFQSFGSALFPLRYDSTPPDDMNHRP